MKSVILPYPRYCLLMYSYTVTVKYTQQHEKTKSLNSLKGLSFKHSKFHYHPALLLTTLRKETIHIQ